MPAAASCQGLRNFVGQPLLAVPSNLGRAKEDSQEWLSYVEFLEQRRYALR